MGKRPAGQNLKKSFLDAPRHLFELQSSWFDVRGQCTSRTAHESGRTGTDPSHFEWRTRHGIHELDLVAIGQHYEQAPNSSWRFKMVNDGLRSLMSTDKSLASGEGR